MSTMTALCPARDLGRRLEAGPAGRIGSRLHDLAADRFVEAASGRISPEVTRLIPVGGFEVDDGDMARSGAPRTLAAAAGGCAAAGEVSADAFGRLAVELHDLDSLEETVEAVVQFALHALGCTCAGVVLIAGGRRPEMLALTDPRVAMLYDVQIETGTGPMITAIQQQRVVIVADAETETRWPSAWTAQARAAQLRSVVHLPLIAGGHAWAVLSLYSSAPNAFDADDLALAHILARHASVAIANARQEATLTAAIDARKLVGQAMGILMERYDLDGDRAFEVLKRYSQQHNRKLRDVAQELVDTRRLPH
jgi:hypothetical protein